VNKDTTCHINMQELTDDKAIVMAHSIYYILNVLSDDLTDEEKVNKIWKELEDYEVEI
jgi:hypothetical protein